jgi:hypothetical protein
MTLTATKAHDQFMPALSAIPHSLRKYGHHDIELVFTDNVRGDKTELEHIFPSLLHDILPVPKSSLPMVSLPEDWSVDILRSAFQVNSRLDCLMDDLGEIAATDSIPVAMDMEWSVSLSTGIQSRVGLVQIVYKKCVYLIPVSDVTFYVGRC